MATKTVNVALIGSKFMGRVHSNAYLKVGKFFDLPVMPVMDTVTARDGKDFNIGNFFRKLVGVLRIRMGWILVLGSSRKCIFNAMALCYCIASLNFSFRKKKYFKKMDCFSRFFKF